VSGLLNELGRRLAERWAALLVFPGLLFVGALAAAAALGGVRWSGSGTTVRHLVAQLTGMGVPRSATTGILVCASLVGLALISAAAGLAAQGLGAVVAGWWSRAWPRWATPVAAPLTRWRRRRWTVAQQRFSEAAGQPVDDGASGALAAARNAIGLQPPRRPTWIADRMLAADARVWQEYGLDLAFCWPRLWLVIPDAARSAVDAAHERWTEATILAGWAVLYALLGALWWPAAVLGLVLGVVGWRRARAATAVLTDIVEAVVDVYGRDLAAVAGLDTPDSRLHRSVGLQITERFRKSV
jgi:hypothetical protein